MLVTLVLAPCPWCQCFLSMEQAIKTGARQVVWVPAGTGLQQRWSSYFLSHTSQLNFCLSLATASDQGNGEQLSKWQFSPALQLLRTPGCLGLGHTGKPASC